MKEEVQNEKLEQELSDEELDQAAGGWDPKDPFTTAIKKALGT